MWEGEGTAERFEAFGGEAVAFFVVVGTEFGEDAADGDGVCEEFCRLAEGALVVYSAKFSRVEVRVPIRHVDECFFHLRAGVFEFREEAAGAQVVVVFVDLAQRVADFKVRFIVVGPVGFAAGDGDAAVGAFEADVGGGLGRGGFAGFGVVRGAGLAGAVVGGMGTVGVGLHEGGSTAYIWGRGGGEGVEEVIGLEEDIAGDWGGGCLCEAGRCLVLWRLIVGCLDLGFYGCNGSSLLCMD